MIIYDFYGQEKNVRNYGVIFIKYNVYRLALSSLVKLYEKIS